MRLLAVLLCSVLAFGQGTVMPILGSTVAPAAAGGPAVSHIEFFAQSCWRGSPCALTIPATATGSSIVTYFSENSGGATGSTSTATGATFSTPTGCNVAFGGLQTITVQVAPNVPSGITTVNIGGDGTGAAEIMIAEVTGVLASPVDVCNASFIDPATASFNTASITTTANNDFVLAFANEYFFGGTRVYTWTAPCTIVGTQVASQEESLSSKTLTATATTNCAASVDVFTGKTATATLALKY